MIDRREPPIPFFTRESIPEILRCIEPEATAEEVCEANEIRKLFFLKGGSGAYMIDIVRAFRALSGASVYVEVGSRDKGNIAWLQRRLDPEALIIDVDLEQIAESAQHLINYMSPKLTYVQIEGDSISLDTAFKVQKALGDRRADAIFLDSSHMYNHMLSEFNLYFPLLRPGGLLLIHDIFWQGNEKDKGKAQALQLIDRYFPVYAIMMNEPLRRFFPLSSKADVWGGVGIIVRPLNLNGS
jgi:Cephalosporin hydroxylase